MSERFKLTVIPELCSGCRICELACAAAHFQVNNPKKAAVRVLVAYPHPVIRMPVICSQCRKPPCGDVCPVNAIHRVGGAVKIDRELCISCFKCLEACPFGAIFAHPDCPGPIKCDLCGGDPECVKACPKEAIRMIPEQALGETRRLGNLLSYAHMKEIEFFEKGEKKVIRYTEVGKEEL